MLQSVPVFTQSVRSAESATVARASPFAVTSGSRNFSGSSGRVAGAAMADTRWLLRDKDRYAGSAPAVTAYSLSQLLVGAAAPPPAARLRRRKAAAATRRNPGARAQDGPEGLMIQEESMLSRFLASRNDLTRGD